MATSNTSKSRSFDPDSIPELEVASADGAYDNSGRPSIGDDDCWLGDTVEAAVRYAGDHRTDVVSMMH